MRYTWDIKKEKINIIKHGISFLSAKEAIECNAVVVLKTDHVENEERYVYLGICEKLNILVVVVAYPNEQETRIISARKANKKERLFYEKQL